MNHTVSTPWLKKFFLFFISKGVPPILAKIFVFFGESLGSGKNPLKSSNLSPLLCSDLVRKMVGENVINCLVTRCFAGFTAKLKKASSCECLQKASFPVEFIYDTSAWCTRIIGLKKMIFFFSETLNTSVKSSFFTVG